MSCDEERNPAGEFQDRIRHDDLNGQKVETPSIKLIEGERLLLTISGRFKVPELLVNP